MKRACWFVGCCFVVGVLPVLAECPSMDFTGDCFVDLADFAVFVDQWLTGIPKDTVLIPGGTFQMGNSTNAEEGDSDELPVHTVTLDSFAIGKYEVTKGQYCAFLNSAYPSQLKVVNGVVYAFGDSGNSYGYCDTSTSSYYSQISFSNDTFSILTKGGKDMTSHPMIEVSWYGAAAYCNWRSQQEGKPICYDLSTWNCDLTQEGYRLPTEAEWEYAGRGGLSGKRFPWGDTITHSQANYRSYWEEGKPYYPYDVNPTEGYPPTWNDGIVPYTSPVGSFAANGLGLCDMAGNALELCNDWYSDTYYSSSPTNNPKGPTTGNARVIRGGSWYYIAHICRVSKRGNLTPDFRGDYLSFGFRVVLGLN